MRGPERGSTGDLDAQVGRQTIGGLLPHRRKVILRVADLGLAVARGFFEPLAEHVWAALADLPDRDLASAHRTFGALIDALESYRGQLEATSD